jgi:probable rRNA maturation factor
MTRPARKACRIEVLLQSGLWKEPGKAKTVLRRAVRAAAAALSTRGAELAIVLSDDSAVRLLNRQWRGIDKATNVLSFPTETRDGEPPQDGEPPLIGDIVLAYETIAREARNEGKPFAHHLAHLAVHGFLHLNGYDHERDEDAEAMEELERRILRRLAIADPYRPRAGVSGRPARKTAGKTFGKAAKAR